MYFVYLASIDLLHISLYPQKSMQGAREFGSALILWVSESGKLYICVRRRMMKYKKRIYISPLFGRGLGMRLIQMVGGRGRESTAGHVTIQS